MHVVLSTQVRPGMQSPPLAQLSPADDVVVLRIKIFCEKVIDCHTKMQSYPSASRRNHGRLSPAHRIERCHHYRKIPLKIFNKIDPDLGTPPSARTIGQSLDFWDTFARSICFTCSINILGGLELITHN